MSLYRRLARSKRGIGTIFGALFFVILILMGFNLMLWSFIQQDSYNGVVSQMNQADQQATSENLVPQEPGVQNATSTTFNISVNNEGGTVVTIARIYITGFSTATRCVGVNAPCIVNPAGTTADPSCVGCSFDVSNVAAGVTRLLIPVNGLDISDCSPTGPHYRIVMASSRGRLFSLACPWESPAVVVNQANIFTLNIGPLSIFFDFNSFNFTRNAQTQSQPAWVLPSSSQWILWLKVVNQANTPVTIAVQSGLLIQQYTGSNAHTEALFIVNSNSVCPNPTGSPPVCQGITAYTPVTLPAATSSGPSPAYILKFAASAEGGSTPPPALSGGADGTYLAFIGLFYYLNGNFQGETVPFVAINLCGTYPNPC